MKGQTHKWDRATQSRTRRKAAASGATMQLYREIAEGYAYFMAKRTRAAALRPQGGAR